MFRHAAMALAACATMTGTAQASAIERDYIIKLRGLTVGKLMVAGTNGGDAYDIQSQFRTTGVAGVVANVRFVMRSLGEMRDHMMVPTAYVEQMNTGYRQSEGRVSFGADDGRWDPNSALVYMFGSRPLEQGCAFKRTIYDGARTNDLSFAETNRSATEISCYGAMTRVAGYSAEELAARPQHKLTVTYARVGDRFEFSKAVAETIYGRVTITPH